MQPKILPVTYVAVTAVLMYIVAKIFIVFTYEFGYQLPVSLFIFIAGLLVVLAGGVQFRKAATTINPLAPHETSALVNSGVYRLSRNPMYLGFLMFLIAWNVYLGNLVSALFLPLFIIVITVRQILPEERILEEIFGEEYRHYLKSVRRWI